jgi:hypothetical protein
MRSTVHTLSIALMASSVTLFAASCDGDGDSGPSTTQTGGSGGSGGSGGGGQGGGTAGSTTSGIAGSGGSGAGGASPVDTVAVHLVPKPGVTGDQRVNFAVPLAPGQLGDAAMVRVLQGGSEIASARRGLASHPDGSVRSVQIQVDLAISGEVDLEVVVGEAPGAGDLSLVPVESTLELPDGTMGPRVWAVLPASYLSATGVLGPLLPEADVAGTPLAAWSDLCDYDAYDVGAFVGMIDDATVWLFDRGTALYRGYARTGEAGVLESAYRETAIYRAGITGTDAQTTIGIPGKADDAKYYYSQNLAIHYLMTGDDRFRESAEDIATRMAELWPSPGYSGGADFWTERHAGFALLAYVWAMIVSDDEAGTFRTLADDAVTAYVDVQETYPAGYDDPDARCFAHSADAAGEGYGYFGCSPWLSAILADGLDAYATESGAAQAAATRASIVKLGRILARDGRDAGGKPFYWMGVGTDQDEIDDYDEHWGESAYVIAMAYFHDGQADTELEQAANELVQGFGANGVAPHMRSFNWQCRSAVATPWYLSK